MKQYINLIKHIARRYHIPPTSCLETADLIQEGYIGLLEAQKHYCPKQNSPKTPLQNTNASFETYAASWIHKFINEAIHRYRSAISYPPSHPFGNDDGTIPLNKRIASTEGETDTTLADTIADNVTPTPEQCLISLQDDHILRKALAALNPREQFILTRFYGLDDREPATTETLAKALSISHWAVHKLRQRALTKLKNNATLLSNFPTKPVYT